jgi:adenylosuccinate synthase
VIKIAVAYKLGNRTLAAPPAAIEDWHACQPVYKTFKGWRTDTTAVRSFKKLPPNAQAYLRAVEQLTGAKVKTISVGPRREQTFSV